MMSLQTLQQVAEKRRTIYALNKQLPVSTNEVLKVIEHAILHTPSSFNSQSTRLVVLLGQDHEKLWDMTADILRNIVNDAEKFKATEQKLNSFKAGVGTILFYEDQEVVKGLQQNFAAYADGFPIWAEHANAMHQYAIWNALSTLNIGASLQHYSNLIEEPVAKAWGIAPEWKLIAQMVFGGIAAPAGEKTFEPVEKRLKVYGQ